MKRLRAVATSAAAFAALALAAPVASAGTQAAGTALTQPTDLHVVSATDSDIQLAWNPATGGTGYVNHEVFVDDEPDQYPITYDAPDGHYDVTFNRAAGLIPGSTHTFRIRAVDHGGHVTDSETITGTFAPGDNTPPTAPSNLRVVKQDGNGITLAWDASVDANSVQYFVDGAPCSPRSYITGTGITIGSLATDPVCGISKGTYTFSVRARDSWDNDSAYSAPLTVTYQG